MQLTAPNMVSLMRLWNFLTRYLKIESSFRRRVDGYYLSSGCHYTMLSFTQRRTKTSINVGNADAEEFVKAFQHDYRKLVFEELSLSAAQRFVNRSS
ncbi:uncharacterized protein [Rutidosis leptorrhynchoides]|uniref:uncharacterized protein isoform X4 n=1 Tax=Rutidosis leptorrhynchoides TaxID=125765 RepID=UPI003A993C71